MRGEPVCALPRGREICRPLFKRRLESSLPLRLPLRKHLVHCKPLVEFRLKAHGVPFKAFDPGRHGIDLCLLFAQELANFLYSLWRRHARRKALCKGFCLR